MGHSHSLTIDDEIADLKMSWAARVFGRKLIHNVFCRDHIVVLVQANMDTGTTSSLIGRLMRTTD